MKLPDANTVVYLEADVNYTTIHTIDGKKEVKAYTIAKVLKQYPDFQRISKGVGVNPAYVSGRTKTNVSIANKIFNISRRRR